MSWVPAHPGCFSIVCSFRPFVRACVSLCLVFVGGYGCGRNGSAEGIPTHKLIATALSAPPNLNSLGFPALLPRVLRRGMGHNLQWGHKQQDRIKLQRNGGNLRQLFPPAFKSHEYQIQSDLHSTLFSRWQASLVRSV